MVSFQIISYNKSRYLINAVTSILKFCPEPFEILVYEGHPSEENKKVFEDFIVSDSAWKPIQYFPRGDNLGYAKGHNWLSTIANPDADVMIQLSEDMFFGPNTIRHLLNQIRGNPQIGIISADAAPIMFDRFNPSPLDVDKFADANQAQTFAFYVWGSGFPFCMKTETWRKLMDIDVWEDRCLPFNSFPGAFDEAIDPSPMGWASDWDLIARLRPLGLRKAVLTQDHIYHYDHVSGQELDTKHSGWTQWALDSYFRKHPTANRTASDDQCFQKRSWDPEFGKWCPEPWASIHQHKP